MFNPFKIFKPIHRVLAHPVETFKHPVKTLKAQAQDFKDVFQSDPLMKRAFKDLSSLAKKDPLAKQLRRDFSHILRNDPIGNRARKDLETLAARDPAAKKLLEAVTAFKAKEVELNPAPTVVDPVTAAPGNPIEPAITSVADLQRDNNVPIQP